MRSGRNSTLASRRSSRAIAMREPQDAGRARERGRVEAQDGADEHEPREPARRSARDLERRSRGEAVRDEIRRPVRRFERGHEIARERREIVRLRAIGASGPPAVEAANGVERWIERGRHVLEEAARVAEAVREEHPARADAARFKGER